ncbi:MULTISPECIES: nuclease-related domain-containing protein [Morganellaceae]|uniref:nuclease-related domain-containing protein n=1 Tax=Morganellaceae TaxID=1903414 RepID=UPI00290CF5BB|nr:nuclease-related domain-containing protein [Proteus vulgaris]MDU7492292.1 nuclease-related domain-containing protein [Providencia rettgeri]WOO48154.1 nuclease-related domain-containing protein [Hafnia alvei]WPF02617.1 nuclease-related domain-containing protein [Proteus vulgaris]
MKEEHEKIIKKLEKFDEKGIKKLNEIDDSQLGKILKLSVLNNKSIIIHDIKKRQVRDNFFENLIAEIPNDIYKKDIIKTLDILKGTEEIYDKIKNFIKNSYISKHDIEKQIWAHINRAESEFEYAYNEGNKNLLHTISMSDGLTGTYITGVDGSVAHIDVAIETYNFYLCMYLKMSAYENKLYDINGTLILPPEITISEESIFEAGSILASSISWAKLEEFSNKSLCFGGSYTKSKVILDEIEKNDINLDSNVKDRYVHKFNIETDNYLASDIISNARYFFKKYQNNIEINFKENIPLDMIKSIGLQDSTEFSALMFIQSTLFLKNDVITKKYGKLTLIEWIIGYSELSKYAKENIKTQTLILSKKEIFNLINNRLNSSEKTYLLIDYLTFNKKSKDLFDSPLVKVKGGLYYLCKPSLVTISIDEAILSTFATFNIATDKKGYKFEEFMNENLERLNLNHSPLKFKINDEEYEYDCILVLDSRVFILEYKNRTPTKNYINSIVNKKSDLYDYIEQVKRLRDGLINNPQKFKEKFDEDLDNYEIIPVVLFNHTFTHPKTEDNVYITDSSIFLRFFKKPYISMDILKDGKEYNIYKSDKFWLGESPTSSELLTYMENPPQTKLFINKLKYDERYYPIDHENMLTGNDLIISNFL